MQDKATVKKNLNVKYPRVFPYTIISTAILEYRKRSTLLVRAWIR